MAWLDIVLMLLLVVFAVIGLSKGFTKSLVNFLGTLVVLVVSLLLSKPLGAALNGWFGLDNAFGGMLKGSLAPYCVSSEGGALDNSLMDKFAEILLGQNYWENYSEGVVNPQFLNDFSLAIGKLVTMAIATVVLYLIFKLVIWLVCKIKALKFLTEKRPIGGVERVFGFFMGAVRGVVTIWLCFCVAYLLIPALPAYSETVINILNTNNITNEFYKLIGEFMEGIVLPWLGG